MVNMFITLAVGALLPLFFTRITYNKYVGFSLSIVLLVTVFDGLHQPLHLQVAAVISLLVGFYFTIRIEKKLKRK